MRTRGVKLMAMILAMAMLVSCLAACGGSSSSSSETTTASAETEATGAEAAEEGDTIVSSTNDADGNGRVDKVTYASTMAYTTLIPFLNPKTYTTMVYESLGTFEEYGKNFGGLLMESWEHPDDLTYIVYLYDNIYDAAGNHITADDVVFCYNEVRTAGEISQVSVIDSVEALDEYTVQFNWAESPALGAFEVIMAYVNIVSEEAYEASGDGMASNPVGTGPYMVSSWTSGSEMTLVPNENYWANEDQIKYKRQNQPADEIVIQTITETSQLAMALETGSIDMTDAIASQDADNFLDGGAYSDQYDVVERTATSSVTMLVNVDPGSPCSDENLRQAIIRAIDVDTICAIANGGALTRVYGLGSPTNGDYDEEAFKSYYPDYDLDAAKEYLAASNYPDGCTIQLLLIDGSPSNDIAELIQNQLAQIGITVEIKSETFGNYLTDEGDSTAWDLEMTSLSSTLYCATIWNNAFGAANGAKNFAVDDTLQELLANCSTDATHTQETANAFQKYLTEQVYCIPLCAQNFYNVYNNSLISEITYSGEGAVIPNGFTYK